MSTEVRKVEFLSVRKGCGAVCSNTILKAERRERLIALAPQNRFCSRQASYIMCCMGYTDSAAGLLEIFVSFTSDPPQEQE